MKADVEVPVHGPIVITPHRDETMWPVATVGLAGLAVLVLYADPEDESAPINPRAERLTERFAALTFRVRGTAVFIVGEAGLRIIARNVKEVLDD